jgi:hypothetical protein
MEGTPADTVKQAPRAAATAAQEATRSNIEALAARGEEGGAEAKAAGRTDVPEGFTLREDVELEGNLEGGEAEVAEEDRAAMRTRGGAD